MTRRLTPEAEEDRNDFERLYGQGGNCSCHLSPPCVSCIHPGNPLNQDEDPEAWEPEDPTEQDRIDAAGDDLFHSMREDGEL